MMPIRMRMNAIYDQLLRGIEVEVTKGYLVKSTFPSASSLVSVSIKTDKEIVEVDKLRRW